MILWQLLIVSTEHSGIVKPSKSPLYYPSKRFRNEPFSLPLDDFQNAPISLFHLLG
jgi:hypothetical protein